MSLPFFYSNDENIRLGSSITLDEDTSKHVVQSLRMQNEEKLNLTDGKGTIFNCIITDNHRKKCRVEVIHVQTEPPPSYKNSIAISPIKNASRFEWFLEKATELGVTEIVPLQCRRTEKISLKTDRVKNILLSALLQSRQCRLPVLHEPVPFENFVAAQKEEQHLQKFIAHCRDEENKPGLGLLKKKESSLILIGPEGDFTKEEIDFALKNNFVAVSLGATRLRTETAGVAAAVLLTAQ